MFIKLFNLTFIGLFLTLLFISCEKNNSQLIKTTKFDIYANDTSRFIAHAGGEIDGKHYTNSLEALNLNYKRGFRIFELDIIETSDKKYVASHDWKSWKTYTSYKGTTPVSLEEFHKHKIHNKYTAISLKDINLWFLNHEDAILVTDKINTPIQFSKSFIDKKRLIMELFSVSAIQEAKISNIKFLVSQNVLIFLDNNIYNKFNFLKKVNAKYVAISRNYINGHRPFLKQMKDNNIKVYLFHINGLEGKDEHYVVNYEMDLVYGIYADKWSF